MDHITNYLNWLKANMKQTQIDAETVEITTPFLDRHNDYTQIYIKNLKDHQVCISDQGYIVDDLKMCGISLKGGKRSSVFHQILSGRGIQYNDKTDELYVVCNRSQIAENQHTLLQCMLDINDMFYLSTDTVSSVFYEDVLQFFDHNDIFYSPDIKVTGKSGLSHDFPFVLQKNKKHPERMIKLANRLDKNEAERIMFAWSDVSEKRTYSQLIVFINDLNTYNKELPKHMAQYNPSIISIKWTERDKQLEKFA
ncbi:DUF1828 domain-containing protein [Acidaminococcus massiliensis]|uniref:DUF1828 domain-containing protein n=1 Tax=Acidaminococcus massiliensis TaxID=1852375 RepID=UPI0035211747